MPVRCLQLSLITAKRGRKPYLITAPTIFFINDCK